MDQFTEMMNTEFDLEANDYLDKLLESLDLWQEYRKRAGLDPLSTMELSKKVMAEFRPEKLTNFSVALAAAMLRLQEGK